MITKYASFEDAQILDLKGSQERSRTASLDKISEFEDYRTEQGYLYARIRAISSRVNRNHDGWPSVELAGNPDIFSRHQASEGFVVEANKDDEYGFSTFLGKPIFVDHHNSDPRRARGVIVDAKLHVEDHKTASLDPYYANAPDNHLPPTWIELLLEVDAKSFPRLAKAIVDGSKDNKSGIDGFSMGANVGYTVCSHCNKEAHDPEDYCEHVRLKGAHFDKVDKHGRKVSAKAYEDCHEIKFFEISAVFDPADETALLREVKASVNHEAEKLPNYDDYKLRSPYDEEDEDWTDDDDWDDEYDARKDEGEYRHSSVHLAENPLPQSMMETAPENVDTLEEEDLCPVCGSSMAKGEQCEVCGYVSPPESLGNPDLTKAQENDLRTDPTENGGVPQPSPDEPISVDKPTNPLVAASVRSDMAWTISHPKLGAINPVEKPIKNGNPPMTNEPNETVVQDYDQPTTSRTAASMIADIQRRNMSATKTAADAPEGVSADKRVDVTGVGGVMDANNESASKADAQVDVEGVGGTGVEGVDADEHETLPSGGEGDNSGYNKDKNIESIPTKTFPSKGQQSPVTQKAFPTSKIGAITASYPVWHGAPQNGFNLIHQNTLKQGGLIVNGKPWDPNDRSIPYFAGPGEVSIDHANPKFLDLARQVVESGSDTPVLAFIEDRKKRKMQQQQMQGAKQGVEPVDPVGKAEERVDVEEQVAGSGPENNSGKTKTWNGTDGNGVLRQQDPVTNEVYAPWTAKVANVIKVADMEVELGLADADDKYNRIEELGQQGEELIQVQLDTLSRVKRAGLKKNSATRANGVGRVPSFRSTASNNTPLLSDEALFM